jgi:hypothetical protein
MKLTRQVLLTLEKMKIAVIFQGVSGQMLEDVKAGVHSKTASTSSLVVGVMAFGLRSR